MSLQLWHILRPSLTVACRHLGVHSAGVVALQFIKELSESEKWRVLFLLVESPWEDMMVGTLAWDSWKYFSSNWTPYTLDYMSVGLSWVIYIGQFGGVIEMEIPNILLTPQ